MAITSNSKSMERTLNRRTIDAVFDYGYILLACLPPALAFWYVRAANTNVVFADLWGHMQMIKHFLEGTLRPEELFLPHNQNRPVILNVVLLISAAANHFMIKNVTYIFLIFQIVSFFALTYMLILANVGKLYFQITAVVISFLLFSLSQWENYTLAINLVFASTVAFSLLAILAWQRHLSGSGGVAAFPLTLLFAELATYSMGGGVVIWAVLPILGLLYGLWGPTSKRVSFAVLLVVAAASLFVYGRGLPHPVSLQSIVQQLSDPVKSIQFILVEFGSSVLGSLNNVVYVGVDQGVGVAIAALYGLAIGSFFLMTAGERRDRLPIFGAMLLALGELALIWLGREQGGLEDAASSRYVTLTSVGAVAALMLIASRAQASIIFRVAFFLACSVCLSASIASGLGEFQMAKYRRSYQQDLRHILETGDIGDDQLRALEWPVREDVVEGLATLKHYRLSQFYKN